MRIETFVDKNDGSLKHRLEFDEEGTGILRGVFKELRAHYRYVGSGDQVTPSENGLADWPVNQNIGMTLPDLTGIVDVLERCHRRSLYPYDGCLDYYPAHDGTILTRQELGKKALGLAGRIQIQAARQEDEQNALVTEGMDKIAAELALGGFVFSPDS